MKVIKWIIIIAMVLGDLCLANYVITACAMVSDYSAWAAILTCFLGLYLILNLARNFNEWFDSNLRTNNVKTNEENNTPS